MRGKIDDKAVPDLHAQDFTVLLGPCTPSGHGPPVASMDDSGQTRLKLNRWRASNRPHLQALAQAVAGAARDCVLYLSVEPDTPAWFRDVDPAWREPLYDGEQTERMLLPLVKDHRQVLKPHLEKALFDLRRLNEWRWVAAQYHCHDVPLLVLGVDPEDPELRTLLRRLHRRTPGPCGWLLWPRELSTIARVELEDIGFVPFVGNPLQTLRELAARPNERGRPRPTGTDGVRLSEKPYRLLDAFGPEDASLFFGRNRLTERLLRLVAAYRLVIVTGGSGSGKTSLINAGLLARVRLSPNAVGISVRCEADPIGTIVRGLNARLGASERPPSGDSLSDYLKGLRNYRFPVIVLDQAEEIYTRLGERPRVELLRALREALCHSPQLATFVISLREDYLSGLSDLRSRIPTLLQTTLYVPPLSAQEAREAILGPARTVGFVFDPDLADTVLDELTSGNRSSVSPPQMQIVCSRLYDSWIGRGRPNSGISLDTHRQIGGSAGILGDFVEHSLKDLRAAGEEDLGWTVLKAMVTSEGTKDLLPVDEIAVRADLEVAQTGRLLEYFRDHPRLVRSLIHERGMRFELAHEYLVSSIWQRMSEWERRQRQVEEDLGRELLAWEHFADVRLGRDRLERYTEFPDVIARNDQALTLVLLSTIKNLQPPGVWVALIADLPTADQDHYARKLLRYVADRDRERQRQAAEVLARLHGKVLKRALRDEDKTVSVAALQVSAALDREEAIPAFAAALGNPQLPLAVKQDVMASLLRMWGGDAEPPRVFRRGERAALDQLINAVDEGRDREFALGALLDVGRNKGLRRLLDALISSSPAERSAADSVLNESRAARLGRFMRYKKCRQPADKFWPALADISRKSVRDELQRELLNFRFWRNGRWERPTPYPRPAGWPLSSSEIRSALESDISDTWLEEPFKQLKGEDNSKLRDDCSFKEAHAFLKRADYNDLNIAFWSRTPLLIRLLREFVKPTVERKIREKLVYALESSAKREAYISPAAWQAVLSDDDDHIRTSAYKAAISYGPPEIACCGFEDESRIVRSGCLTHLEANPRTDDNEWWEYHLDRLTLQDGPEYGLACRVAARHGLAEIAMRGVLGADTQVRNAVLEYAQHFLPYATREQLDALVEATFFGHVPPMVRTRALVLSSLAGVWERLDRGDRLLATTIHHSDYTIRAAATNLARASGNFDALALLMADRNDSVKEQAWEQLLKLEPGTFSINAEALVHLLADSRTSWTLLATACRVAGHHRVVEATNALKDIADDQRMSRIKGKTIGQLARAALLETWPDAAAWIRMTAQDSI